MANFNLNKVIIGGRLTDTPVLNTTTSGIPVTTFTVAVNRRFADKQTGENTADFLNVTAWRQTAEFITRYFRKASSICVVGSIQTRSWTDKDGQKRHTVEIVADEAYFVDARAESSQTTARVTSGDAAPPQTATATYIPEAYTQAPSFGELEDGEELPF